MRTAALAFLAAVGATEAALTSLLGCVLLLGLLGPVVSASAQQLIERDSDLADRPISLIRVEGASDTDQQLILNNVRAAVGDPYEAATIRGDVSRIYSLGKFKFVTADAQLEPDGTVGLIYAVTEQPLIAVVQVVGNKRVSDQDLLGVVQLISGSPRDDFLIEKAKRDIREIYRKKGYYLTEVTVDESDLEESGLLIFRVIEGPRVRVKSIVFEGAESFSVKRLQGVIKTRTHVFIIRQGVLDEELIEQDKAALDRFYKDRGFLDVRIGHRTDLAPDNTEVKITFFISEGRQYTLRSVRTESLVDPGEPLQVFAQPQIAAMIPLKTGDVYSRDALRKSRAIIEDAYGILGYLDVRVVPSELRSGPEPEVDLLLEIDEGRQYKVGVIRINGNFLTQDKVVRRLIELHPGRPFNSVDLVDSERRISQTQLFNDVRVTIQEPDPIDPEYRDVLVEVRERNTGSVGFGIALGSDAGIFGDFSLSQNNFDVADFPESFNELVAGRAFRGAGQRFNMAIRPGNELFQYVMSLTEPHLFESDYALTVSGAYRERIFSDFTENRISGTVALSRSFGEVWRAGVQLRAERVELSDFDLFTPTEVLLDAGPDTLTGFGFTVTRSTLGSATRPSEGTRLEIGMDWFGALGAGDVEFLRLDGQYTVFLTLDEDFLGRKHILKLNTRVGYIFGDRAPTYERYYMGGRSFRGFDFRTVSPKGVTIFGTPTSDPVGGNWLFFTGAQYEFPLFAEVISGVVFVDTGTVLTAPGFDDYRLSIGAGLRLHIPQLGPVPIAFDFGFPLLTGPLDEERLLTFSAELPF